MRARRFAFLLILVGAAAWAAATSGLAEQTAGPARPTLLLLSFDGFRVDYLERFEAPSLHRLIQAGVRAEYLVPVFPTKTYPNHYTIVTGLYPDHHGIVLNEMWDPEWQLRFDRLAVGTKQYDPWWGGEPIWLTARRQGRASGTMFWPGSDAEIQGERPNDWYPYDATMSNETRVDRVLAWLDRPPASRPSAMTLYFSDADDEGHLFGPNSKNVGEAVARIDAAVGRLIAGLEARNVLDEIDIVALSDHGMAETPLTQVIFLDNYVDVRDVDVSDWSPVLSVWPKPGRGDAVLGRLQGAHPHLTVYRAAALPERWHLGTHRRVAPIVGVADEGWTVTTRERHQAVRLRWNSGNHGFDNALASMRAIFIARGPHFRRGAVVPPLENIHLYELMCHVLGVRPAPNDGRLSAVAHVLSER